MMNLPFLSMRAMLSIMPFFLLLFMIATGPVLYPDFWHRRYVLIATCLGVGVLGYYLVFLQDVGGVVESVADYIQFIALIGALYVASSGILIEVNAHASTVSNLVFLWCGALLSNVIGTTGASMLLIRPYIRLNKKRIKAYHIVFFIFMVSNVGGALTAIADPPNFIGFLKGVPFFWTLWHNFQPWLLGLSALSLIFFFIDQFQKSKAKADMKEDLQGRVVEVRGWSNIGWLILIVLSVFIDPNVFSWVPGITYQGHHYSFVREILLCILAFLAYRGTDEVVLEANGFSFEPLKEVVFIFIGIFGTMMPALALISEFARSEVGQRAINPHTLYWLTGLLSSVLDNAPTYLNFLTAGMAAKGLDVHHLSEVTRYANEVITNLRATSIAAVFFGAMTYVGNGPNFMVRAIAVEQGIEMPSFGRYFFRYSLPFLLPVLGLVWLIFFWC